MRRNGRIQSAGLAGCVAMMALALAGGVALAADLPAKPAAVTAPAATSPADACADPQNVWGGWFAAKPNSSGSGPAPRASGCFATKEACEKWLAKTSASARATIVLYRCELRSGN